MLLAVAITVAGTGPAGVERATAGWSPAGSRSAVEVDLRNRLYGQLQRLELSFFDRQQTGQLMSRATVDLQSVRFFLGYGLIFIAQSVVTILLAAVAMFVLAAGPGRDLARAGPVRGPDRRPLRAQVAPGDAGGPAADRRADRRRRGERLRRARRQGVRPGAAPARRFAHSVQRVFDQQMVATRIQAFYNPLISFLPNLGLAAILLFGGREVIDGTLTHRRVHRLLRLPADADLADADARLHARRGAALDRLRRADLPDPRPRAADRRPAGRAAAARRRRARDAATTSA